LFPGLATGFWSGLDDLRTNYTCGHLRTLREQPKLFGLVASDPIAWRVVDKVDEIKLDLLGRRGKSP
jgi:hypothetical protein